MPAVDWVLCCMWCGVVFSMSVEVMVQFAISQSGMPCVCYRLFEILLVTMSRPECKS